MAPRSFAYKQLQKRIRRTLKYGERCTDVLSFPLSEFAVNYFDHYAPFDYMKLDYAANLSKEGCVNACTFLVAMVYIDRVRLADQVIFEESDPSELYLSALVVASKYLHDGGLEEFVYNDEWAVSAASSLKRVNDLEVQLLNVLSWNICVNADEFERILCDVERWVASNSLSKNGFGTYNELSLLVEDSNFYKCCIEPLLRILATFVILYSAFAFSLVLAHRLQTVSNHRNSDLFIETNSILKTITKLQQTERFQNLVSKTALSIHWHITSYSLDDFDPLFLSSFNESSFIRSPLIACRV
ncbi:hypothetical protein AB6A40_000313 [Gnathostoma spinigerum]|uniref:Protein CNPPD1 n=1 Tax=Gnathostoma spinigerum TaxID=75299 RepID=A0ABD6E1U8_9BILA